MLFSRGYVDVIETDRIIIGLSVRWLAISVMTFCRDEGSAHWHHEL
jgi:hypothetical protein